MKKQNTTSYQYTNRLKAETSLELFDKYYLSVKENKANKAREFKLELAILNPNLQHVKEVSFNVLAASIISALVAIYFLSLLVSSPTANFDIATLGAGGGAALLSVLLTTLFVLSIKRKWVFETRTAHHPLVEIPYHKKDKKRAQEFASLLQNTIEKNITEKGYNSDHLFAGEMRMLRRLAKSQVLSSSNYDRAKKQMLQNKGQLSLASS